MKRFFVWSVWGVVMVLQSLSIAQAAQVQVIMTTSMGVIELELDNDKAPKTVANFLRYAKAGKYDNTIFHRVIPNFMIQGGGFDAGMHKKPSFAPISNEADNGLANSVGSIAMARTNDPQSASNQFFINTNNNSFLNHTSKSARGWGYAVFGKVIRGMNIVRKIESVKTGVVKGMRDVPLEPVMIQTVKVIEWKDSAE